jgi:uncharacterized Zn-binding protein involved in type VI secretion
MKNIPCLLTSFALRVGLLFAALALVSAASAQTAKRPARSGMMPPVFVSGDSLTPPGLNADGSITLPDGTVVTPPARNSDGSRALPEGDVVTPPTRNSDGTITLPDGTVVIPPTPNADGTITLLDGTVIDPSQHAARRGARPSGGS